MQNQTKRVALDGTTPLFKPDMTLGGALQRCPYPPYRKSKVMIPSLLAFVNRLTALSDFPFLAVFISHLWRSDFPQAAVYVPFWNGVNKQLGKQVQEFIKMMSFRCIFTIAKMQFAST